MKLNEFGEHWDGLSFEEALRKNFREGNTQAFENLCGQIKLWHKYPEKQAKYRAIVKDLFREKREKK